MVENTCFFNELGPFWCFLTGLVFITWLTEKIGECQLVTSKFSAFLGLKSNGRYIFQLFRSFEVTGRYISQVLDALKVTERYIFQLFSMLNVTGHYIFQILEALHLMAVSFRKYLTCPPMYVCTFSTLLFLKFCT